ncbi:hypothetical protein NGF19_05565 [Streptomyces sp. RY43-2]|uniref:Integral membrane protein n=1 Tax=Streptomyces macrolidinus TaxID=2952607 RepID=A0ABT0Z923_9ACTN|nr:hypothetical protein [Streptomyces macrolidinus]MCN9240264.1 hypothetical protein [Streptomyces macrolidinus]
MGTKTVDEADAATGAEATTNDEKTAEATTNDEKTAEVTETEVTETEDTAAKVAEETPDEGPSGVGQGAGAVVSAGLGVVSLTGSWVSTVASARETLLGQLKTSTSASVGQQIKAVYGEAWHATALWGGVFALAALIVGVVVLARPAFGAPGKPQAAWIKSVAWGGVSLGVIGLLLAVLKYTDVLLGLPSA